MKHSALFLFLILTLSFLCACTGPEQSPPPTETKEVLRTTATQNPETDIDDSVDSLFTSSEEIEPPPSCEHTFTHWETVVEATEEKEGLRKHICTLCGEEETEIVPALPVHVHRYTETSYLADCTEEGFTEKACACGHTLRENTVKALGHRYSEWTEVLRPTFDRGGIEERECLECGFKDNRSTPPIPIPEKPHAHEFIEIPIAPTCTTPGRMERYCACGLTEISEEIPPTNHSYGEWYQSLAPGKYGGLNRRDCDFCSEVDMQTIPPIGEAPESPDNPGDTTDSETSDVTVNGSAVTSGSEVGEDDRTEDTGTPEDTGNPEDPSSGTILYYNQRDERWGSTKIGCGNMKNNGCGPTAIAMALSFFGIHVTPLEVANWLHENTIEFNHAFHGISGTGLRLGLEHWNRTVYPLYTYDDYINHLRNGAIIVGAQGQGTFVTKKENSHCIVIANLTEKGKVTCYDPYTSRLNGTYYAERIWEERSEIPVDLRKDGVTHYAVY